MDSIKCSGGKGPFKFPKLGFQISEMRSVKGSRRGDTGAYGRVLQEHAGRDGEGRSQGHNLDRTCEGALQELPSDLLGFVHIPGRFRSDEAAFAGFLRKEGENIV